MVVRRRDKGLKGTDSSRGLALLLALKKAWKGRAFSHSEGFRKHAPLQPDGVEALAPEQAGNLVDVVDMQTVRDVVLAVRAVCVCVRAKGAN